MDFITMNERHMRHIEELTLTRYQQLVHQHVESYLAREKVTIVTPFLTPMLFPKQEYDGLAQASKQILSAVHKIYVNLYETQSREQLLERFAIPPEAHPYIDWERSLSTDDVFGRMDIVMSAQGRFYLCELNMDSGIGGFELYDVARYYDECLGLDLTSNPLFHSPYQDIGKMLNRICREKSLTRIVILMWAGHGEGYFTFNNFRQYVAAECPGIEVHLMKNIDYPSRWLEPEESRKTLVYRYFSFEEFTDGGEFYDKLYNGETTIIRNAECSLFSSKKWLPLLCDSTYHHLLSSEEIAAIKRYVPHSAELSNDNIDHYLDQKDEFVFKRASSHSGIGVLVGLESTRDEIVKAIAGHYERWMVQQYIPQAKVNCLGGSIAEGRAGHFLVFGLYLIKGTFSGMFVRGDLVSKVVGGDTATTRCTWGIGVSDSDAEQLFSKLKQLA